MRPFGVAFSLAAPAATALPGIGCVSARADDAPFLTVAMPK